ncbi:MAG: glycosyltransferase, partial [Enterococcus hulanensis]
LVDFSVIHGGEGTVQTACSSGKPFIGIGLQYEQEVNVAYCVKFGNAVAVSPKSITPHTLEEAIRKIGSPEIRKKAQEMHYLMKEVNGAEKAAEAIQRQYLE